jgi:hypothetical protein
MIDQLAVRRPMCFAECCGHWLGGHDPVDGDGGSRYDRPQPFRRALLRLVGSAALAVTVVAVPLDIALVRLVS